MPRKKHPIREKLESLKPGEWFRIGKFSPKLSATVRDRLRDAKLAGVVPESVEIVHNCEGNLLAVHLPKR